MEVLGEIQAELEEEKKKAHLLEHEKVSILFHYLFLTFTFKFEEFWV